MEICAPCRMSNRLTQLSANIIRGGLNALKLECTFDSKPRNPQFCDLGHFSSSKQQWLNKNITGINMVRGCFPNCRLSHLLWVDFYLYIIGSFTKIVNIVRVSSGVFRFEFFLSRKRRAVTQKFCYHLLKSFDE